MYDPAAAGSIEARLNALVTDREHCQLLGAAAARTMQERQFIWEGNARRAATEARELLHEAGPVA